MSGRNIRDICEHAERRRASLIIQSKASSEDLPTVEDYLSALKQKRISFLNTEQQKKRA
jgi:hypothetical protein